MDASLYYYNPISLATTLSRHIMKGTGMREAFKAAGVVRPVLTAWSAGKPGSLCLERLA